MKFLQSVGHRVSSETSFDSKQPKMEPKLVLALSDTKRLFWFFTETASFCVSIELKQKKAKTNWKEQLCIFPQSVPTKFFQILAIIMLPIWNFYGL